MYEKCTIPVYLDDKLIALEFESVEAKDFYVKQEMIACVDEYNNYLISANSEEREKFKKVFREARVKFAKMCGFRPVKNNNSLWRQQKSITTTGPASAA